MSRADRHKLLGFALCAAIAVAGLWQVLSWQFDAGDVYPDYSSRRADPLGTRALYESLGRLPGLVVRRNDVSLATAPPPAGAALLFIGVDPARWSGEDSAGLLAFVRQGGRLIVALEPVQEGGQELVEDLEQLRRLPRAGAARRRLGPAPWLAPFSALLAKAGVELHYTELPRDEVTDQYVPATAVSGAGPVPGQRVAWHSALAFRLEDDAGPGQVILRRGADPVLVSRALGQGTLILATDSYWLSNEGLRAAPHAELLAWLVGPHRTLVFDETHLGVSSRPGVGDLAREYGLTWLLAGLALLSALFVWRSMTSLVPPPADWAAGHRQQAAKGKTAAAGLVHLLRLNLSPGQLLPTCIGEWERSCRRTRAVPPETWAAIERLRTDEDVAHDRRLLVEAYRRISVYLDPRLAARPARPITKPKD